MPRLVHKYSLQHYSELPKTGEGLNFHSLVNGQNVYIHTVEYYSALKRNELLAQVTTWVNLANIKLHEKKPDTRDDLLVI